jgi:hypothetical protein
MNANSVSLVTDSAWEIALRLSMIDIVDKACSDSSLQPLGVVLEHANPFFGLFQFNRAGVRSFFKRAEPHIRLLEDGFDSVRSLRQLHHNLRHCCNLCKRMASLYVDVSIPSRVRLRFQKRHTHQSSVSTRNRTLAPVRSSESVICEPEVTSKTFSRQELKMSKVLVSGSVIGDDVPVIICVRSNRVSVEFSLITDGCESKKATAIGEG